MKWFNDCEGVKDPEQYKDVRIKHLRDYVGSYDILFPKGIVRDLRMWPDGSHGKNGIWWWNMGMGDWHKFKLNEDFAFEADILSEIAQGTPDETKLP